MQPVPAIQDSSNPPAKTIPTSQFYQWINYQCAYQVYNPVPAANDSIPLVLIHPIGVGLSKAFWQRFCQTWYETGHRNPIYNPDLLGCGESEKPPIAYYPSDWAQQLDYFLQSVVQKPAIIVVQGALLPVALILTVLQQPRQPNLIKGLVLAGPSPWALMSQDLNIWQQRLTWNLLYSPLGNAFYRYARRKDFLRSFSTRRLFAASEAVDTEWLETLKAEAADPATRYAVFSFLARFWRQNYLSEIESITQPVLVVVGEQASSVGKAGQEETPKERLGRYLAHLPNGEGLLIPGRNVLPYESTTDFVKVVGEFVAQFKQS
ncbi:MAG: alpha/beta fold hydrolase [Actinomycetota bacterium]